jgi:hypothetical protein
MNSCIFNHIGGKFFLNWAGERERNAKVETRPGQSQEHDHGPTERVSESLVNPMLSQILVPICFSNSPAAIATPDFQMIASSLTTPLRKGIPRNHADRV